MRRPVEIIRKALRIDRAAGRRLARDLDDEFTHHLEQTERELIDAGLESPEARRQALERFGDVAVHRTACVRIARQELLMIHKLITAGLAVTTLLLALASIGLHQTTQRAHAQAQMHAEMALHERDRAAAVTEFLATMIASTDRARAESPAVADLLEQAAVEAKQSFADQPEIAERVRAAVDAARQEIEQQNHE